MAAVKRRINSTGRKRVGREYVAVAMLPPEPGSPPTAKATIRLEELSYPGTAAVVLEAYQRSSAMRFKCGTFAEPDVAEQFVLDDLDPAIPVLFRLKIVDREEHPGRLLGSAERIRPLGEESPDRRRSLFPIERRELHSEVWKVEIDAAGPVLVLNYNIPGLTARIQKDPLINGILLPAALRIVLERLASDPGEDVDAEVWKTLWFKFLREDLSYPDDPAELDNDEDRASWIDGGVRAFCKAQSFVGKIKDTLGEEA